jgi:toxin ParE1/3/4
MVNYKLSKAAEQDIENILDYSYLTFGEKVAENYFIDLKECLQTLSENLFIGINSDSLRKGYFRHPHQSHIIFYKLKTNGIFIVRILHKNMDIKQHL